MTLLLIALGAFALTEFVKNAMPWSYAPWAKMVLATVAVVVVSVLLAIETERSLSTPTILAAVGLATLIHKGHRLLSALGDAQQVGVMMKATRAGRRG